MLISKSLGNYCIKEIILSVTFSIIIFYQLKVFLELLNKNKN